MPQHLYALLVYVHVLAALLWLGGMFFFAVVGAPALRQVEPAALRRRLFHDLGLRFRRVGWWAIGVLVLSGIWVLHLRGALRWSQLSEMLYRETPFGRALFWKLVMVLIMISASLIHDFVVGPQASFPGDRGERARRRAAILARGNAVAGLLLVYWATRLARGG
jgi:copper resistance protein D